jgi:hypothetical protein
MMFGGDKMRDLAGGSSPIGQVGHRQAASHG